ncbi:MAG TPA: o-succinylbenzoate synthase [Bryobacteraceae bacterium]|nr:o-succinylbenzoate synthase [Bryobacteraceae bacterium]
MVSIEELAKESGPLRFTGFDLYRIAIPMREPFRISSGEVAVKDSLLLKINGGDAFGWGESSAMPGAFYSSETPDSCWEDLSTAVLPALASRWFPDMVSLEEFLKERSQSAFVRVAVETAAWELLARRKGISLRSLFSIADRDVVSGLAVGLYDTREELREALERYRPRDYARLKIKIKRGQDVELVRAVREWFPDVRLFVDANADYGREDFATFQELDAFGLMMFEQPLARSEFEASAELQRLVRTPVCLDESIETADDARRAIQLGSCRIVNIKLQRVGGYLEALRIIEICSRSGIPVWMGTMPELGIGSAQALQLAAHPAFRFPTDVEPSERWYEDDILTPRLSLANTRLPIPAGPGIGFQVDERKLEQYCTARKTFKT